MERNPRLIRQRARAGAIVALAAAAALGAAWPARAGGVHTASGAARLSGAHAAAVLAIEAVTVGELQAGVALFDPPDRHPPVRIVLDCVEVLPHSNTTTLGGTLYASGVGLEPGSDLLRRYAVKIVDSFGEPGTFGAFAGVHVSGEPAGVCGAEGVDAPPIQAGDFLFVATLG